MVMVIFNGINNYSVKFSAPPPSPHHPLGFFFHLRVIFSQRNFDPGSFFRSEIWTRGSFFRSEIPTRGSFFCCEILTCGFFWFCFTAAKFWSPILLIPTGFFHRKSLTPGHFASKNHWLKCFFHDTVMIYCTQLLLKYNGYFKVKAWHWKDINNNHC